MSAVLPCCNVRNSRANTSLQHVTRICSILAVAPSAFLALWNPPCILHTISNSSEEKPGESIYYSFLLSLPAFRVDHNTFVDTRRCCTYKFRFLMEPVKSRTCSIPSVPQQGNSHFLLQTLFFSPSLFASHPAHSGLLVSLQVNGMHTKSHLKRRWLQRTRKTNWKSWSKYTSRHICCR